MDDLRMGAIVLAVFNILMLISAYYFGVYSSILYRPKHRTGKGYSINLQGGILSWVICIFLAYVVIPSAFGSDLEFKGFISFLFGTVLFAACMCSLYTTRILPKDKRRYQYMLASSLFAASLGLLSQGIPWMLYLTVVPELGSVGLISSLIILAVCEIVFLQKNEWRLLPGNPK